MTQFSRLFAVLYLGLFLIQLPFIGVASSTGISQLLIEKIAIPTPRPGVKTQIVTTAPPKPDQNTVVAIANTGKSVAPTNGNLKQGLNALSKKKTKKARSIRQGMAKGSLDRKILAWAIALSGQSGIPSGQIAQISRDLSSWPGQKAMRSNGEVALAAQKPSAKSVVAAFGKQRPESVTGAILLAKSQLALGNKKAANQAIAPIWRKYRLSKKLEAKILKQAGSALTLQNHRDRMHYQFYRERTKAANRMASRAQQSSLAKARTAVVKRSKNAGKLLNAVAASSKRDPGYTFARIQYLRRADRHKEAAKLLLSAPRQQSKLVHPDEWWIERRIISRIMLDAGDANTAYKIAANHSAKSRTKRAEAEFHAGWYALRYLKNRNLATKHFKKILKISGNPISQARGYYWLGRAASGPKARKYYQSAAKYTGTYYGQLALIKLGKRNLGVRSIVPTQSERNRFASRELVKAIKRLESVGYAWRADIIYRHLAGTLKSAGEIALLSARAEKQGKRKLALQIGKIGYRRGFPVINSSWPLGAIPKSAKIGNTSRALAYSIARQESAFDKAAVSPANARGLLQLLPGTAKLMAKKTKQKYSYKRLTRDAAYNATLGAAYLSEQLSNFGGSYILTFAGYNAGPGRARKWIAKYGDPRGKSTDFIVDWVERIPFTETRNYVQRVMENLQVYQARISRSKLNIDKDLARGKR